MKALFLNLILCLFIGTAVSHAMDLDPGTVVTACVAASVGMSFMPMPQGVTSAVVLRQMWETALIEAFRSNQSWLGRIPRKDQYVGNNAINLVEIGADPAVLINNTIYPIASAQRVDDTLILALNKYDTENTIVTHDELYAIPYDKEGSVVRQHRDVLMERTGEHGLYLLAPGTDSVNTPVLNTSGANDGTGRLRLLSADLIKLKSRLDNLKVPKQGRILVLCSEHVSDLLLEDQSFQLRYNNTQEGTILGRFYGFDVYEDVYHPVYNAGVKKAFGAAPAGGDRNASTVFYAPRAFQASGSVEMFSQDKFENTTHRQGEVGFRMYNIVAPMKNIGFGAVVSG